MSRRRVLVACLMVAAACGNGAGDDVASSPCGVGGDDDAVRISLQWTGWWGNGSMRELFASWDEATPDVDLDIRDAGQFLDVGVAMVDDDPPVVAQVSYAMLPTLVAAGAVRPMGDCLTDAGVDFDGMVPGVAALADVDGERYGAPASLDTLLLLYDRAAFRAAGLDPDDPPTTLAELYDAGVALRDRAGFAGPVAWEGGHVALLGLDLASEDARVAAEQWTRLGRDGLLYQLADGETLPPIGSGRAAVQLTDMHGLWGYASAIADGQAPDVDLAVARLPGLDHAIAPLGGGVWVVSAKATPAQVAAAARFIAWVEDAPRQIRLHEMDDLLPTSTAIADEPQLEAYWDRQPLLRDAWLAVTDHPTVVDGWMENIGTHLSIWRLLDVVALEGGPFDETWDRIVDLAERGAARQTRAPEALLRCVHGHADEAEPALALCS